jgi:hypothetical protein
MIRNAFVGRRIAPLLGMLLLPLSANVAWAEIRELQCPYESGHVRYLKFDSATSVLTTGLIMGGQIQGMKQGRARVTDAHISLDIIEGRQRTIFTFDRYAGTLHSWWTLNGSASDADQQTSEKCRPFQGLPGKVM